MVANGNGCCDELGEEPWNNGLVRCAFCLTASRSPDLRLRLSVTVAPFLWDTRVFVVQRVVM